MWSLDNVCRIRSKCSMNLPLCLNQTSIRQVCSTWVKTATQTGNKSRVEKKLSPVWKVVQQKCLLKRDALRIDTRGVGMWLQDLFLSLHTCPPLFSGPPTRGPSEKRLLGSLGRLPEAPLSNKSAGWPTPHRDTDKETRQRGQERRRRTGWEKEDTTVKKLDCTNEMWKSGKES